VSKRGNYQRVMEVAPNEKGEGFPMTLFWDGDEACVVEAVMMGQKVTTEVSVDRLLADVYSLKEEAVAGDIQIVNIDQDLVAKLEDYVNG
jgi:hypothetical protein